MRRSTCSLVLCAAFLPLVTSMVQGQEKGKPAPEEQTGLAVGEKAPDFVLKDQNSEQQSLKGLLKKGKVALVFYRSADW